MGPAFFGFYAYFGALIALDEEVGIIKPHWNQPAHYEEPRRLLQSVSGASAGAMAAILLAAGIPPRHAADFASSIGLLSFADPPGMLAAFSGTKFEGVMRAYIEERSPLSQPVNMEDGIIPVAVTAFDVFTLSERLLSEGPMARAARASAAFPGLFSPVWWPRGDSWGFPSLLIDGGVLHVHGLNGIAAFPGSEKRVVNLMVGKFLTKMPPGPSRMPEAIDFFWF
jgi:predicted acylesterase/phospholipase RssA